MSLLSKYSLYSFNRLSLNIFYYFLSSLWKEHSISFYSLIYFFIRIDYSSSLFLCVSWSIRLSILCSLPTKCWALRLDRSYNAFTMLQYCYYYFSSDSGCWPSNWKSLLMKSHRNFVKFSISLFLYTSSLSISNWMILFFCRYSSFSNLRAFKLRAIVRLVSSMRELSQSLLMALIRGCALLWIIRNLFWLFFRKFGLL